MQAACFAYWRRFESCIFYWQLYVQEWFWLRGAEWYCIIPLEEGLLQAVCYGWQQELFDCDLFSLGFPTNKMCYGVSDKQWRLYLYSALFIPLRNMFYLDKRSKKGIPIIARFLQPPRSSKELQMLCPCRGNYFQPSRPPRASPLLWTAMAEKVLLMSRWPPPLWNKVKKLLIASGVFCQRCTCESRLGL